MRHWITTALAMIIGVWALVVLESARTGLSITDVQIGETPVTIYTDGTDGPPVIIAHGFAGSRQMMQGYSLVLAQAGYTVHAFDFEGHGLHPMPMGGDVNALDGTTQRLVEQTRGVLDQVAADVPIALLGHSMATDILVRVAQDEPRVGPIVLLSAFSRAIDATHPTDMLLITGEWEPRLTDFAVDAVQMVDGAAGAGQTVTVADVSRRAVLAPLVEHVAILQSRVGRAEALGWLNRSYAREQSAPVPPTGWALLGLLASITALAVTLTRLLPTQPATVQPLSARQFLAVAIVPALLAPLIAAPVDSRILPVLVADYLALHLALYGVLQLGVLRTLGRRLPKPSALGAAVLVLWGIGVFGLALDRYGANFWPTPQRLPIIAALILGALPFMLADARAAFGAPLWQRLALRVALLVSLGIAVALDFEGLFFLIMIAPVIILFFLTFGLMGRAVARATGPSTAGLALGLVLAWALGVSFPLFSA
ncbi:alpha/beta hydrolase [uncultured Tateyamaria sp.]|uniref:alpha/beta hydrolase n=1 Tax=uncultured Tateyamaria sp. TaxID=455651 RepID=UPI002615866A|nr:alpha/beta fold hydrolase [uncultured Tateyamaria sp.]